MLECIIIMATFGQKRQTCTNLEVHSSLVSKVGFVPSQSDDDVGAGLSLEFLYPVLCSGESVLEFDTLISMRFHSRLNIGFEQEIFGHAHYCSFVHA